MKNNRCRRRARLKALRAHLATLITVEALECWDPRGGWYYVKVDGETRAYQLDSLAAFQVLADKKP